MKPSPTQVLLLNAEILQRFPVWRFLDDEECGEDEDESFVTPAEAAPSSDTYGSFVVSARFRLDNGDELSGAVQLDQLGRKRVFTPILIHAAGKILDPLANDVADRLTRLRKIPGGPPVGWQLAITLPGDKSPATGRIPRSRIFKALGALTELAALALFRHRR